MSIEYVLREKKTGRAYRRPRSHQRKAVFAPTPGSFLKRRREAPPTAPSRACPLWLYTCSFALRTSPPAAPPLALYNVSSPGTAPWGAHEMTCSGFWCSALTKRCTLALAHFSCTHVHRGSHWYSRYRVSHVSSLLKTCRGVLQTRGLKDSTVRAIGKGTIRSQSHTEGGGSKE